MTSVIWITVAVLSTFTIGYMGYSRYLSQFVELDADTETPAHKYEDGQEYVPSKKPVLLGHHFSSIAGGAPIVGPITAGAVWGWVPALLWIAVGNPLMGSVHDFVALSSSLRHEGKSIGYIIGQYVGERGKNMLLWFAFLTIILVVAVFALVVAIVFDAFPQVTTASFVYIALALVFGVYLYQLNGPFVPGTVLFVAAVFGGVWLGIEFPFALFPAVGDASYPAGTLVLADALGLGSGQWIPGSSAVSMNPNRAAWVPVIMLYAGIASALPVWTLLQPRDYLSSFLLYTGVGGALLAIIVGTLLGTSAQPLVIADSMGAFNGFWGVEGAGLAPLFPLLFITIACGAISGFHSLVASGTSSKQLDKEPDARTVGYLGALGEGALALITIIAVATVFPGTEAFTDSYASFDQAGQVAVGNFIDGASQLAGGLGIPAGVAETIVALIIVCFAATTLDSAVRLMRYIIGELGNEYGATTLARRHVATSLAVGLTALLVLLPDGGQGLGSGGYLLWPLFGTSNQLLAGITLMLLSLWLYRKGRNPVPTLIPMVFLLVMTIWAMVQQVVFDWSGLGEGDAKWLLFVLGAIILGFAVWIVLEALRLFRHRSELEALRDPADESPEAEGS